MPENLEECAREGKHVNPRFIGEVYSNVKSVPYNRCGRCGIVYGEDLDLMMNTFPGANENYLEKSD
jgi:hypothetical protein